MKTQQKIHLVTFLFFISTYLITFFSSRFQFNSTGLRKKQSDTDTERLTDNNNDTL